MCALHAISLETSVVICQSLAMEAKRLRDYQKGIMHGKIIAFNQCGWSTREIGVEIGMTFSAVAKILRKNNLGVLRLRIPLGRRRITTDRADRLLTRLAKANHFSSAQQLLELWRERVSKWTVYRRLRQRGLRRFRLMKVPYLTRVNMAERLRWAEGKVLYRDLQWDTIVWSDESRFCLKVCDGRARVWRERGLNRFNEQFVAKTVAGFGGSVHVWGAIWTNGRSELQVLNHNVTAVTYIQTLQQFLLTPNLPVNWKLQDDNATPHRAHIVRDFKNASGIRSLTWPSKSPDLNPIEHIWDVMGREIQKEPEPNLQQLAQRLVVLWNLIPQVTITNLVRSMNRRIAAVITARGSHTKY